MNNLDLSKLAGVSVRRADVARWLRWNPSSVIAAENKRIFLRSADGRMSAFDVINYALTRSDPGSLSHNYALSWAKFLINGERDEFYPPTVDELQEIEERERELRKTPQQRLNEASMQLAGITEQIS
jgi:hypothetical protein